MKHILIEMEKLKNPNSGLGQFCLNIGEQFQDLAPSDLQLDFYLPDFQKNIFGEQFNYIKHTPLHKLIPMQGKGYDVWHCLQQDSYYLPANKNTKLILTIHDLNFLEKYSGYKLKRKLNTLQKKVNRADVITVISEFTKAMVYENLKVNNTAVHVIHNGNSLKPFPNAVAPDFIREKNIDNYIFSIGIISPKKNMHTLLPLLEHNKELHLIIAGNNTSDYAQQISKTAKRLGIESRVHLIGTIDDSTKYWLYKNCMAFVFPSLSEGFGLPVVEAMSLGKPAFLSQLTSLPEIGGNAAYYWNNFEPAYMNDVFKKGMNDFNNNPQRKTECIKQANTFSWEAAAKAYLDLYRQL